MPDIDMSGSDFDRVVEDHAPAVYRYLARRIGPGPAEDVTAEVFAAAFSGAHTYDAMRGTPIAWLMGIASNALTRHWRTEQRQLEAVQRLGVDPLRATQSPSPESQATESDETRIVAGVLATLPEVDREALMLYAWADLSYAEVVAALDVPVGTVRSRIARARGRLREGLRDGRGQLDGGDDRG
ncbi:MAG: RNA polymerase sigma factor [Acidimicrobiia bacterium]|nr:RNA polymerase sigma factor [Acidimicrobiia bacterium]